MSVKTQHPVADFSNTEIAFAPKTDLELRRMAWLFKMMSNPRLVDWGARLAKWALKWRLPLVETITLRTIYPQFVGGKTLLDCSDNILTLQKNGVSSILDYGVEAKQTESEFNNTMNEVIRALEFANTQSAVPIVSTKITGMARFGLLESLQAGEQLSKETRVEYRNLLKRLDSICTAADAKNVGIYFDAEESWIQGTLDHLVELMMRRYNKKRVIVYNTYQMYRTDRLNYLFQSYDRAREQGYMLGAKLVRGAYMDKERERAREKGYPSPIHPNKAATDDAFNMAVRFCVDQHEDLASCNASHNAESAKLQAQLIHAKGIQKDHPHLNFCQLYGMSDHLTFNLADAGYNVAKYLPYGPVREVIPYLIRRAEENQAVTGDMGREMKMIMTEMRRRGM